MRIIILILCLLFAVSSISEASETPNNDLIRQTTENLKKDIECSIVLEFSLRNFNLFIAQIQAANPDGEDRTWLAAPLAKMMVGFGKDADYHRTRLIQLGLTVDEVDGMINPIKDDMYSRYMTYYANSIQPSQAKSFIEYMFSTQTSCKDWFDSEVLQRLDQKENEIDG